VSAARHRGTRVVRQGGAALIAGALALFSGGIIGHALSVSTTTLTSPNNPSVWGQPAIFTATITPVVPAPTGTVTFQDGGVNIAGCVNRPVAARVATCTTAALAVGSHTVTAVYGGNATYATSTSAPVTQLVTMGSTTTVAVPSVNPSVSGQTVTYTATVSAVAPASGKRTGTVAFQDGGVVITGCGAKAVAVAGTATCAIAYPGPGAHTITAIYRHDRGRPQLVGKPLQHRRERHSHRQRHSHSTRVGDADGDCRLSGWRSQHRGLQCPGPAGVREGHLCYEHADRRREHDHRHLQR
jgi:hypothetical protein